MLRHDASPSAHPSHPLQIGLYQRSTDLSKQTNIFAFIVEIEGVSDQWIRPKFPIIAICDSESQQNWVSGKFVEALQKSVPTPVPTFNRASGRKGEGDCINIRWTCEKLGQHSEESTFLIEPKAHFKLLFGCGYKANFTPSAKRSASVSNQHTSKWRMSPNKQLPLSEKAKQSLYQGIENGTLLRLRRILSLTEETSSVTTVGDLEAELEYLHRAESSIDATLSSNLMSDDSSSYFPFSSGDLLGSLDISVHSSDIYTDEKCDNPYTLSSAGYSRRGAPFSLQGWFGQSMYEEPQPWLPRMVQPERNMYSPQRCLNPNPRQQLALAVARARAEKEASEYWQWDEKVQNYKHYDEGSIEPVWYNPP